MSERPPGRRCTHIRLNYLSTTTFPQSTPICHTLRCQKTHKASFAVNRALKRTHTWSHQTSLHRLRGACDTWLDDGLTLCRTRANFWFDLGLVVIAFHQGSQSLFRGWASRGQSCGVPIQSTGATVSTRTRLESTLTCHARSWQAVAAFASVGFSTDAWFRWRRRCCRILHDASHREFLEACPMMLAPNVVECNKRLIMTLLSQS